MVILNNPSDGASNNNNWAPRDNVGGLDLLIIMLQRLQIDHLIQFRMFFTSSFYSSYTQQMISPKWLNSTFDKGLYTPRTLLLLEQNPAKPESLINWLFFRIWDYCYYYNPQKIPLEEFFFYWVFPFYIYHRSILLNLYIR